MFFNYVYYVLDTVSETIIGTFVAKSDLMANRIMEKFDFKKANLSPNDVEVYMDPVKHQVYETFEEVKKTIGTKTNLFNFQQGFLGFEVEDGK